MHDGLGDRIRAILREAGLPDTDWAVERVREDVEIAQAAAVDTAALSLPKQEAIAFVNAAKLMLRIAVAHGMGTPEERNALRRLGTAANQRLVETEKLVRHHWLGGCAANFQGAWEAITARPSGMYYDEQASPTLSFAAACCRIVDEHLNVHAVLEAFRDFNKTTEMTDEDYEAFWQSDYWRQLRQAAL